VSVREHINLSLKGQQNSAKKKKDGMKIAEGALASRSALRLGERSG